MEIKYINLKQNQLRKARMEDLLVKFPYPYSRIEGVQYEEANPSYQHYTKQGTKPYLEGYVFRKGVIGCWIAHSKALESIQSRSGISVILEDDFCCHEDFFTQALNRIENFKQPFDLLIFDPWGKGPLAAHKIAEHIYRPLDCTHPYYGGSHCVFVNNERIDEILDIKCQAKVMDYDGFLLEHPQINCFVFYTGLCWVADLPSDIRTLTSA
ncbi:glycosyltransferase family 25 protein [Pedobacter aquatilis]|uniref:glycosyltransferase family 25 protein n=1 Tax=Pedobacter aquatilis TaxID=351343 RepID=UPI00292EF680|nr:glycosyltransferase family 25 protein [Pedobacter aquatilis]